LTKFAIVQIYLQLRD